MKKNHGEFTNIDRDAVRPVSYYNNVFAKMNYKKIYFSVFILFFSAACFSQQKNPAKAGKPVLPVIKDGVYFTFEDIKKNQPNLVLENLYKSMYDSTFTLWQWAHTANLYYIDKSGTRKALNRDSIWGFSEDGTPYICLNQFFHKINTVGTISLFIEFYPLIRDPLSLVVTDSKGNSAERILDFENGNTGNYELSYFNSILIRDSSLYNQFNAVKKERTKRKKMYVFLEKYNERHPLFQN